jgi:hypothetical protein
LYAAQLAHGLLEPTARAWAAKRPNLECELDGIRRLRPGVRFIHVVRNPANTLASIIRLARQGVMGYVDVVNASIGIARSLELAAERFADERYLVVRYEDMVGDLERTLAKVSGFLEIEFRDLLLRPTVAGMPQLPNSAWAERRERGVVHSRSLKPAEDLEAGDLRTLRRHASRAAQALGYDLPALGAATGLWTLAAQKARSGSARLRHP